ncbi:GtrA family protein [Clostridium sardiniense]
MFGVLTTVINFLVYIFFTRVIEVNFLFSNIIAWFLSVVFAFITNKIYVFDSRKYDVGFVLKEFTQFTVSRGVTGILDVSLLYLFVTIIHMEDLVSKIIIGVIITLLNYIISKVYIFRGGKTDE